MNPSRRRALALLAALPAAISMRASGAAEPLARRPIPVSGEMLPAVGLGTWQVKWILGHPAVTCAIPGTRTPKHIDGNLGAARGALPDAATRGKMAALIDSL